jgi:hypothetical protein
MIVKQHAQCESLFLHVFTDDDDELYRLKKRLRLKPEQFYTDTGFYERLVYTLHDNVHIYIYGVEHSSIELLET